MFAQRGGFTGAPTVPFGGGGFGGGRRHHRHHGGGGGYYGLGYPFGGYPYPFMVPVPVPARRRPPPGEWDEEDDDLLDALRAKQRDLIAEEYGLNEGDADVGAFTNDTVRGLGEYTMLSAQVGDRVVVRPTGRPYLRVLGGDPLLRRVPHVVSDDTQFDNPPPFQRRDIPRYAGWRTPTMRLRRGVDMQYPL